MSRLHAPLKPWIRALCTALLAGPLLLFPPAAPAQERDFGSITVTKLPDLPDSTTRGYQEVLWSVRNRSAESTHRVTLQLPANTTVGTGYPQSLQRISKTVVVAPETTLRVSMLIPALSVPGNGLAVTVDERRYTEPVPWHTSHPHWWDLAHTGAGGLAERRILTGPAVDEKHLRDRAGKLSSSHPNDRRLIARHAAAPSQWSPSWLAYSGWDGVVLQAATWRRMPGEVHRALLAYAETGGNLTLLDVGGEPLRGLRTEDAVPAGRFRVISAGLGRVHLFDESGDQLRDVDRKALENGWDIAMAPWRAFASSSAAQGVRVTEKVEVPVRSLTWVVAGFTLLIGPINVFWLSRRGRRIWLLATVPALSLLACFSVVAWALLDEGLLRREGREVLTILDQGSRRASSFGVIGYYTTLTPSEGLRFSPHTEVTPILRRDWNTAPRRFTLDLTEGQHLDTGWIGSRLPTYLAVRKNEPRRERLLVQRQGGVPHAVNGLGAAIEKLWLADRDGRVHDVGGRLESGESARLTLTGQTVSAQPAPLRRLFQHKLKKQLDLLLEEPAKSLRAGTYVAVLEGSPFVAGELADATTRKSRTVVYGLLAGGDL